MMKMKYWVSRRP